MIHVVQAGETLGRIAARFGTTVASILNANPQVPNGDLIFPGQELNVPGSEGGVAAAEPNEAVPTVEYTVRSGDTLGRVAQHFGVTIADLVAANPQVTNPDVIRPGRRIVIPGDQRITVSDIVTKPVSGGLATWLAVAKREMDTGVDEIQGAGDNPRIAEYHRTTTLPSSLADQDETPWCSSFVNWCLAQAGLRGTGSALARSWLDWGIVVERPTRGSITVFRRDGGPNLGHVGFYWSAAGDRILVLGGNQGDQVSIKGYPKSDVLGYRWPTGAG
jgi:uncharacterized protein (TIGR02594 family)